MLRSIYPPCSTTLGNMVVMVFDDDLMKQMDDGNATIVCGNFTGNASGLAGCKATFPPCACATGEDACQALQQGGLILFLDAIVCMNSAVIDKHDKPNVG